MIIDSFFIAQHPGHIDPLVDLLAYRIFRCGQCPLLDLISQYLLPPHVRSRNHLSPLFNGPRWHNVARLPSNREHGPQKSWP